ncbi:Phosphoglucomutase, cytoplasmic [Tribonema minus]|uniref:phosphoglucomutase (alpha-D-glucose-1,6-bisphosphate-dependent) n=1 Tax=Tribonema minus TaxID=303371 RepID=A0A835Z552_9STRA|nr:Phosphoglucomutase, cytoplasmic [Tribonema minus]
MRPGTSGLRKKVKVWQGEHYLENFVQCILEAQGDALKGATLVVGGDGRYHNSAAIQTIIRMAAANGAGQVWVGQGGLLSTPAVSAMIREKRGAEGERALLGIVLTASHNPGGPTEDFGIKFNNAAGSPATELDTEAVYALTQTIAAYKTLDGTPDVDLETVGVTDVGGMRVEVVDPTEDYVRLLRRTFDFGRLRALVARPDFSMVYDAMSGAAGPYAKRVLVEELGADPACLLRCEPLEDFGGGHPDPNLTYADDLVARMGLAADGSVLPAAEGAAEPPVFGAAADGDGDRNMVLGRRFFVTPSDSLAVIAANAQAIPHFKDGLKAAARSMPTSAALDRVGAALGFRVFETPTGWKFFGNLMDSKALGGPDLAPFLCGEESFGTGSDHVREKDGLWAVLAWLSILAERNGDPGAPLVGVGDVVREHWARFGRNYYARYDYEGCGADGANAMMEALRAAADDSAAFAAPAAAAKQRGFELVSIDDFSYTDPVDGSVSARQGVRMAFASGERAVFRLSGTGSEGATVRVYLERFEGDVGATQGRASEELRPLAEAALAAARLQEFTGREAPTVIT